MIQPRIQLHMPLHVTIVQDQVGYFADIIITDITAGQRNWCFAEIMPRRQNPLYGILYSNVCISLADQIIINSAIILHVRTCTHTHPPTRIHTDMHTHTHRHAYTHTCKWTHTHTHTYTHMYTHPHVHTHTHTRTHTRTHTINLNLKFLWFMLFCRFHESSCELLVSSANLFIFYKSCISWRSFHS